MQTTVTGEFLLRYSFVVDRPTLEQSYTVTLSGEGVSEAVVGNATPEVVAYVSRIVPNAPSSLYAHSNLR